jgi:hypothetical protein
VFARVRVGQFSTGGVGQFYPGVNTREDSVGAASSTTRSMPVSYPFSRNRSNATP